MDPTNRWIFPSAKLLLIKIDACHHHRVLASAVLITLHASKVQHVQFSEYLLIKNCMAKKVYINLFTITRSI
jgi:hypothetical protein